MKRHAPATERNRAPIAAILSRVLPPGDGLVLEIASGSGQHAVYFASIFPRLTWQPTDAAPDALESSAAWAAEAALPNLLAPIELDVTAVPWPVTGADAVLCCNMIHISPWSAAEGLFAGAARVLPPDGLLYLYGPFVIEGRETAPSNIAFDEWLKDQDAAWGVRRLADVEALAGREGFRLVEVVDMPANNFSLIFRKA